MFQSVQMLLPGCDELNVSQQSWDRWTDCKLDSAPSTRWQCWNTSVSTVVLPVPCWRLLLDRLLSTCYAISRLSHAMCWTFLEPGLLSEIERLPLHTNVSAVSPWHVPVWMCLLLLDVWSRTCLSSAHVRLSRRLLNDRIVIIIIRKIFSTKSDDVVNDYLLYFNWVVCDIIYRKKLDL